MLEFFSSVHQQLTKENQSNFMKHNRVLRKSVVTFNMHVLFQTMLVGYAYLKNRIAFYYLFNTCLSLPRSCSQYNLYIYKNYTPLIKYGKIIQGKI